MTRNDCDDGSSHPWLGDLPNTVTMANGSSLDASFLARTKEILSAFLSRLEYRAPHTPDDTELRADISAMIMSWDISKSPTFIATTTDAACCITERAYGHLPYKYQLLIAAYTVLVIYADDLGRGDTLGQVGRWLATREKVADPGLERLLAQTGEMYDYYSCISAGNINASTVEGLLGMAIECATAGVLRTGPRSTLYADFLRRKTGFGASYAFFNFIEGWRDPSDFCHLQVIPVMERYICGINDVLSFYKETLRGETDGSYVHLRAAAEDKEPLVVLQQVADETVTDVLYMRAITSSDPQVAEICGQHLMGYIEFHMTAERYGLRELQLV
ncbi:terpenoid synthase [Cubamyces sp. BRFM 1775]|nr:terpenoid synthase [Cubamyces sp. BRFM 1775]